MARPTKQKQIRELEKKLQKAIDDRNIYKDALEKLDTEDSEYQKFRDRVEEANNEAHVIEEQLKDLGAIKRVDEDKLKVKNDLLDIITKSISGYEDLELIDAETGDKKIVKVPIFKKAKKYYAYIRPWKRWIVCNNLARDPQKYINLDINLSYDYDAIIDELNHDIGIEGYFNGVEIKELRGYFQKAGLSYARYTSAWDKDEWSDAECFNKMNIVAQYKMVRRKDWPRDENGKIIIHRSWEPYFRTLSGLGKNTLEHYKAENYHHIRQWCPYGLIYPERNFLGPHLSIVNPEGDSFKGVTADYVLPQAYTNVAVRKVKANISKGFDRDLEGTEIAVWDDQTKESFDQTYFKSVTGNKRLPITPKGMDTYIIENTARHFLAQQQSLLEFNQDGESVWRRISLVTTYVNSLSMFMWEYKCSPDEAKDYRTDFINNVIGDRDEVAKMFEYMIEEYGMEEPGYKLEALHGQDFRNQLDQQRDGLKEAFNDIYGIFVNQKFIPYPVVKKTVEAIIGHKYHQNHTKISNGFDQFLRMKREDIYTFKKKRVKLKNADGTTFTQQCNGWSLDPDLLPDCFQWGLISNAKYDTNRDIEDDELVLRQFDHCGVLIDGEDYEEPEEVEEKSVIDFIRPAKETQSKYDPGAKYKL